MVKIESNDLRTALQYRINDLTVEIEKDRKSGIFRSESDVRIEEIQGPVFLVITALEKWMAGDIEGLNELRTLLQGT